VAVAELPAGQAAVEDLGVGTAAAVAPREAAAGKAVVVAAAGSEAWEAPGVCLAAGKAAATAVGSEAVARVVVAPAVAGSVLARTAGVARVVARVVATAVGLEAGVTAGETAVVPVMEAMEARGYRCSRLQRIACCTTSGTLQGRP
jgi:hypothetical protein